jgi:hypothetical protein
VSLHLHTEHDAAESIERGIAATLSNIEHLVARGEPAG